MMFIYTIHPTGFDYGSLLTVNEQMFHRFYRTGVLTMIDIMVSLINRVIQRVFAGWASDIRRVINASFRL